MKTKVLNRKIRKLEKHKLSRKNQRRFYTQFDMAEIKRDQDIINSRVKRGEMRGYPNRIQVCSCGAAGCFIHW